MGGFTFYISDYFSRKDSMLYNNPLFYPGIMRENLKIAMFWPIAFLALAIGIVAAIFEFILSIFTG